MPLPSGYAQDQETFSRTQSSPAAVDTYAVIGLVSTKRERQVIVTYIVRLVSEGLNMFGNQHSIV